MKEIIYNLAFYPAYGLFSVVVWVLKAFNITPGALFQRVFSDGVNGKNYKEFMNEIKSKGKEAYYIVYYGPLVVVLMICYMIIFELSSY